ncbi:hypothetical protein GWK47_037049 [Chionoecetes opilio]|uniref:Uncharacterized protein n=1 Tax=Chionoecetes opilio TaxID=41210 RepID=A0A8J5D2G1_CHIOP|nr:hypothetical protein GWK47_037049 [Chionoecetes opilio]
MEGAIGSKIRMPKGPLPWPRIPEHRFHASLGGVLASCIAEFPPSKGKRGLGRGERGTPPGHAGCNPSPLSCLIPTNPPLFARHGLGRLWGGSTHRFLGEPFPRPPYSEPASTNFCLLGFKPFCSGGSELARGAPVPVRWFFFTVSGGRMVERCSRVVFCPFLPVSWNRFFSQRSHFWAISLVVPDVTFPEGPGKGYGVGFSTSPPSQGGDSHPPSLEGVRAKPPASFPPGGRSSNACMKVFFMFSPVGGRACPGGALTKFHPV